MQGIPKNDKTIMAAMRAQNNNQWAEASALFQQAGNQMRNPAQKEELWKAASRAKQIHYSD